MTSEITGLFDADELPAGFYKGWEVEQIGKHHLNNEHYRLVLKVSTNREYSVNEQQVRYWLTENTYYQPTHTGVEGCPGREFIAYVDVVYISDTYSYALVEVSVQLDV